MNFVRKIAKLFSPDSYSSAVQTLRRMTYPLAVKPFVDAIDKEGFEKISARYAWAGEKVRPSKYLQLDEWMPTNVKRVRDHRLRKAPPKLRILDIGSGNGYFLHIARCLGHEVLGLDRQREPMYEEMFALLRLERAIHEIKPFEPLPALGGRFDLITAHMTCFNWHPDGTHWVPEEWEFFLRDLCDHHLAPGGRIQFELNPLPDNRHMEPTLRRYFRSLGAKVDRRRVYLTSPFLSTPPGLETGTGPALERAEER